MKVSFTKGEERDTSTEELRDSEGPHTPFHLFNPLNRRMIT